MIPIFNGELYRTKPVVFTRPVNTQKVLRLATMREHHVKINRLVRERGRIQSKVDKLRKRVKRLQLKAA